MVYAFIIALGTLITVVVCWLVQVRRFSTWTRTSGTVIAIVRDTGDGAPGFAPMIQFSTPAGRKLTVTDSLYSSTAAYAVGDAVCILFDPENPTAFFIDALGSKYSPFMFTLPMTAFVTLILGFAAFKK